MLVVFIITRQASNYMQKTLCTHCALQISRIYIEYKYKYIYIYNSYTYAIQFKCRSFIVLILAYKLYTINNTLHEAPNDI